MTVPMQADGPTASAPLLSVRGVRKAFGANVVLRDLSLEVDRGDCVVLIGASGSGKSPATIISKRSSAQARKVVSWRVRGRPPARFVWRVIIAIGEGTRSAVCGEMRRKTGVTVSCVGISSNQSGSVDRTVMPSS